MDFAKIFVHHYTQDLETGTYPPLEKMMKKNALALAALTLCLFAGTLGFADAKKDKEFFRAADLKIPFISLADFIKNKEAVGRKKDLQDVKRIQPKAKKIQVRRKGK